MFLIQKFKEIRSHLRKHSRYNIPYSIIILSLMGSGINIIYSVYAALIIPLDVLFVLILFAFSWTVPAYLFIYWRLEKEITISIYAIKNNLPIEPKVFDKAKKRLKKRPLYSSLMNFLFWFLAGIQNSLVVGYLNILTPWESLQLFIGIAFLANPVISVICYFMVEVMSRNDMRVLEIDVSLEKPQFGIRYKVLFTMIFLSTLFIIMITATSLQSLNEMMLSASQTVHEKHIRMTFILSGICILYIVLAAYSVAKSIIEPIEELSKAMKKVEDGDIFNNAKIISTDEVGGLTKGFNSMMFGLRERENIKKVFGHYVSEEIRDQILNGKFSEDGEEVFGAVLFSDLRNFTTISETLEPKKMILLLNEYFSEMVEIITIHEGIVDKFMGDAVMAIFGGPKKLSNPSLNAVKCAKEMVEKLKILNQNFEERNLPILKNGVGIATGNFVMGNIGSKERKEFTVIGDIVNQASRLESLTKTIGKEILFNEETFSMSKLGTFISEQEVKGKTQKIKIYTI